MDLQDKKDIIISELETLCSKETIAKNFFKVRAYRKVIDQLHKKKKITSFDDISDVSGIGEKIHKKIEEILMTGKLRSAERAREITDIRSYEELLKIHGVGITTAKELVEGYSIRSIAELKRALVKNPNILNAKQTLGLQYYDEVALKIPRVEIDKHARKLSGVLRKISMSSEVKVVGSYRRGAPESGDIDVIITVNRNSTPESRILIFKKFTDTLKDKGYLVADLGSGNKKYMGICKLNKKSPARRIDILLTSKEEFPFAMLYFTGDFDINIALRKRANELGYILNEHGITPFRSGAESPVLRTEKEIFNFLGYRYLLPKRRNVSFLKKL